MERFGRFPDRNAILGRDSTSAELAFLARGNVPLDSTPSRDSVVVKGDATLRPRSPRTSFIQAVTNITRRLTLSKKT